MRNFTWMQGQVGEPIGSHHTIPQPNSRDLSSSHLVVFSKGNLQQIALLWVWGNHKSSFLEGWISLVLEETRELTSTNLPTIWLAWVLFLGAPAKSRKNGVQKNVPNQLVGVCWGKWLATSSTGPTPVPCRIFFCSSDEVNFIPHHNPDLVFFNEHLGCFWWSQHDGPVVLGQGT